MNGRAEVGQRLIPPVVLPESPGHKAKSTQKAFFFFFKWEEEETCASVLQLRFLLEAVHRLG